MLRARIELATFPLPRECTTTMLTEPKYFMHLMRHLIETVQLLDEPTHYGASFHLFEREEPDERGFKALLAQPTGNPKIAKTPRLSKFDANLKIAKSGKEGVLTVPLHLAPADRSGFNMCACSTAGCRAACLHTAGDPRMMVGKERARVNRTLAYMNDRERFMDDLADEITRHGRRAERVDMLPAVRLNATSDVPWERVPLNFKGEHYPNIMVAFPHVQFYDYTKIVKRMLASLGPDWPANYHLTFSLSENNDAAAAKVLDAGGNVAVVFRIRPSQSMPKHYTIDGVTRPVINGEEHDFRPIDDQNVIVGLRAKGLAKQDVSGFVREP